jgi:uncharacterized protein YvpB
MMKGKKTKLTPFLAGFVITFFLAIILSANLQPWNWFIALPAFADQGPTSNAPVHTPSMSASPFQPLPSPTITHTPTRTPVPSITPTVSSTMTASATITTTASETVTVKIEKQTEVLPEFAFVQGYPGHAQLFSLDCESRIAVDMAAFFGVQIDEMEFLERLPRSDDPNEGFVGDLNDEWGQIPPDSYGVYANPIARLLRNYGLSAYARYGMTMDDLRAELAADKPVMVWVIGQVEPGVPLSYIPTNGNRTTVAHNEHTVTVIGYDQDFVYIIDPTFNNFYMRTIDRFLQSWGVLNYMAVVFE